MIHLRIRTEFSFREAFAPLPRVVERLREVGATAAGCVDLAGSTWGHVKFDKAMRAAGLTPLFGAEIVVLSDPSKTTQAPTAWVLGRSAQALYRFTSLAAETPVAGGGRPAVSMRQFLDAPGLVKFAGAACAGSAEAAEAGVYLDLNPGAVLTARDALATARRVGARARLVLTGDNLFCAPRDRKLHELAGRSAKTTPQHILSAGELRNVGTAAGLTPEQVDAALRNAADIAAELAGVRLPRAPLIKLAGDVEAECRAGIEARLAAGQIPAWTAEYEARLQRELALVLEKEFDSYFLMVSDMVRWAKERMLVGPARGSAAGSLMCYLMRITEVDPLPFGLLFERFVDITRTDLPDIDYDLPDAKRDLTYAYLRERYGAEQVARIGTISDYKPKSALAEVGKRLGIPPWETKAVKDAMFTRSSGDSRANNCLADTLAETEPGRAALEKFPALALAGEIEGHASHAGMHAAGVIVCNEPVSNFCAVIDGVAQLDKGDAEALNLLKVDVLGLRTLTVLEDAGIVTAEQLYNLPLDDPAVFALLNAGKFSGVFQWEGQALQSITKQITVTRFEDMAHITALARPGPLGGGAASKFIARHRGDEPIDVAHASMHPYLDETYGLVLYQEQVIRICRDIGQLSWEDNAKLRKAMSKSYGKEFFDAYAEKFIAGAAESKNLSKSEALAIWEQVNSMGAWGYNKSHAVAYTIISYWTAWCKAHHPLEFAAAALRNAKDDESALTTLREVVAEGVEYVAFDAELSEENWSVKEGRLIGGFLGLKGIGPASAKAMLAERAASGSLTPKQHAKLEKARLIFADLYPAQTLWGVYYDDPEAAGLQRGSRVTRLAELPEEGEVVVIGLLRKKDSRDHNEAVLLARRDGKRMAAPTLFLDMRITDDTSLTPYLCRIDRWDYEPAGRLILERGREDTDWFLIRGQKLRNFPMISVAKIRCLNDPELLKVERP